MNMLEAVKSFFLNWSNFSGRASRSEFWWTVFAISLFGIFIGFIEITSGLINSWEEYSALSLIFEIIIFVPFISLTSRRFQDRGHSGWWQLIYLSPIVVVLFALPIVFFQPENIILLWVLGILFVLILVISIVLIIRTFIWCVLPAKDHENQWGSNPLID